MRRLLQKSYGWPSVIFAAALLIRLLYLLEIRGTPVLDLLLIDSHTYDRFARLLLEGRLQGEAVYAMNVLYPYFLAAIYGLIHPSATAVVIVQVFLDALTCMFIFLAARHLFTLQPAIIAGLLAVVYAPFVFYSGALLTPTLINTCLSAMLYLLARQTGEPDHWWIYLLVGGLLGLAILGRGNSLLFLPLALIFFAGQFSDKRPALRTWAIFTAGALSLPLLITVRNYQVEGRFVPVSANYGAFYSGHHEQATGLYTLLPFTAGGDFESEVFGTQRAVSRMAGRELTLAETSEYLLKEGLQFMLGNPWREVQLTAAKFFYFWNRTESPTNLNIYFAKDFSTLLRYLPGFGILAPLAILGIFLRRRQWKRDLLLYLYGSVYLLTALIFFVSAEYRMPVVPALLPFAGLAIWQFYQWGRTVRDGKKIPKSLWPALVVLGAAAVFCNVRDDLLQRQSLKRVDYLNFGNLYRERGDHAAALRMLRRSLEIDPRYGPAYQSLSKVYMAMGEPQQAARYLEKAEQYALGGQYARSAIELERLQLKVNQALGLYRQGVYGDALNLFQEAALQYRRLGDERMVQGLQNNAGLCLYKLNRLAEAKQMFLTLIAADSTYVNAYNNLGRVHAAQNNIPAAREAYRKALALDPGNPQTRRWLGELAE